MGRGNIKTATISSTNKVQFQFPYGGPQEAYLQLRVHPSHGRDVILSFRKAHFLCQYDGCTVLVRFDDKKPERYSATEPSDHSRDTLFISNYPRFVQELRNAKRLRIEAQFFQDGSRIVEFDVAGLNWDAPPASKTRSAPKAEPDASTIRDKMINCSKEATEKGLKGDERKAFMTSCLKPA